MFLPITYSQIYEPLSGDNNWIYLVMSAVNTVLLMLISYKFLQIMQQSGYEGFGYFKWLRRRDNVYLGRLSTVALLSVLGFLLCNITFSFVDSSWVFFVGFVFYIIFIFGYYRADKKHMSKIPIAFTTRMKRLVAVYAVVLFGFTFLFVWILNFVSNLLVFNPLLIKIRFAPICLMPLCVPIFVLIAYYITKPYEKSVQRKYVIKCKQKLCDANNLIRIGITGSYGKTSVKEVLKTILEEKYNVLASPDSYNTPMGLCKTIRSLKPEHQVFIAEMGARHIGDIKELAEIVKPDYAIINGIVGQHLETFGTLSAIKQTKYELVAYMDKGAVAYTVDNDNTNNLFADCKIKAIPAGIDRSKNPYVYAKDIALSGDGSTFTLVIGDKEQCCQTCLLGSHSISNICLAAAIAAEIGLSIGEICGGISRIKPVRHRLELVRRNGLTILDDSYNANVKGIDAAIEVLSQFDSRRIVVTPGLVELGREEDIENYRLGKKLSCVCDLAVLIGKSAAYRIQDGLVDGGFDPENIILAKDLESASKKFKKLLKTGDVVLFENDLPDKFS